MNNDLKHQHKAAAVLVCLMVHCLIVLGIIIIEVHNPELGPIIMFAADEPQQSAHQAITQEQWVAMNNSLPNAQFMHTAPAPEQSAPVQEPVAMPELPQPIAQQESTEPVHTQAQEYHEAITNESLDEVIDLATQFLEEQTTSTTDQIEQQPPAAQYAPPQPKQITLAQIAQGFMSQIQQQESPMQVDSDAHGQASMQQLQQLHYCQKIIGCIVNAYKINRFNAPAVQQENRLCIHLALKQNGSIHTLRLVESSGNTALDQFVLAMFKDASSSFPPLPQSFKLVPFHLPFFNIDRIESFQTTQGWYIDSRRS